MGLQYMLVRCFTVEPNHHETIVFQQICEDTPASHGVLHMMENASAFHDMESLVKAAKFEDIPLDIVYI